MGRLEAFITSGGLSTTPWTFAGKIKSLDYKTIRYPGHYEKFKVRYARTHTHNLHAAKVLLDLGLLSEQAVRVGANDVVPRQLLHVLLERVLAHPGDKDLVLLSMHAVATNGAKLEMHVEGAHSLPKCGLCIIGQHADAVVHAHAHSLPRKSCTKKIMRMPL